MHYFAIFFVILLCMIHSSSGAHTDQTPVKEGNFALSSSQQPGPLFGFGQNIVDKKNLQAYVYADYIRLKGQNNSNILPGLLYGIRDNLSLFFNIPMTITSDKTRRSTSSGLSLQLEYAYFSRTTDHSALQATILAALSGPNGSMIKQAITNRESSTFFLGATINCMSIDWYLYGSLGNLFAIKTNRTKQGDNFLYQLGIGRNIHHSQKHTYLFLVEFLGSTFKRDKTNGIRDSNSGGNLIFIAPSFWFSSERFLLQIGFSAPILQKLNGNQNPFRYQLAIDLGWKL